MTTTRSFITETNWGLKKEQKDFTSTATHCERQTEEISEFLFFISQTFDAWHVGRMYTAPCEHQVLCIYMAARVSFFALLCVMFLVYGKS